MCHFELHVCMSGKIGIINNISGLRIFPVVEGLWQKRGRVDIFRIQRCSFIYTLCTIHW